MAITSGPGNTNDPITIAVPSIDSALNAYIQHIVGQKGDTVGGNSLVSLVKIATGYIAPSALHHEHIYPHSNGLGVAGSTLAIITDAEDETNGAASTADYWGEPTLFDPSEAAD